MENQRNLSARDIIVYLSLREKGDWDAIYRVIQNKGEIDREEAFQTVDGFDGKAITILDPGYPKQLREGVARPPFVLYCSGDESLLSTPTDRILSVSGTREATDYALSYAQLMGVECANRGIVLCARFAQGCDAAALRACAKAGGKCIMVAIGGLDKPYAPNIDLYWETKELVESAGGVVVSEYPDGTEPAPAGSIGATRLVAGFGKALFVPQVWESGTPAFTAVTYALSFGRDVAALPFEAGTKCVMNNTLISEGAALVDDPAAFLDAEYGKGDEA